MTHPSTPGIETRSAKRPLVALLGNPNTGKSTIFNQLTGLRQRIANYPGITIEAKHGVMTLDDGRELDILDLPGAYSLAASSPDEEVVVELLTGDTVVQRPDLAVCVLDATNLKRNLFLASQLAEYDMPIVLVLNQWDIAQKRGIEIDIDALSNRLGVPIIPTVGIKKIGLHQLKAAIRDSLEHPMLMARIEWPTEIVEALDLLEKTAESNQRSLPRPEAERVLFDSPSLLTPRLAEDPAKAERVLEAARQKLRNAGLNPTAAEAIHQYAHIDRILEECRHRHTTSSGHGESIDALLVHRFWGAAIFVAIMWVVFQSVYSWSGPFMDWIESMTGALQSTVEPMLVNTPIFQSLVIDGLIGGVGGVVIFLPQIFMLFLFIAVLEDSGYMSRAAFLMDKLFGWCGLNGKSFVPLLSSYACAVPGIMAARALEDPKARLTTILMAPFMSCSARLPVYVLMIGAFIEPAYGPVVAGWTLFILHFVGLAVALPLAWVMNRFILHTPSQPFLLEFSGYKIPHARNVLLKMWEGGREFILRAGTVILAFSVVIWALLYFPRPPEVAEQVEAEYIAVEGVPVTAEAEQLLSNRIDTAYVEQSYLGRFGKWVQPVFAPAGFDWKITVGVLSSFPAREVIIATLGIIYSLGDEVDEESDGLRERMAAQVWTEGPLKGTPVFTIPVVLAILIFFALCAQCGATIAVIARQIGWRWAGISFCTMTVLAWTAAVLVYQIGSRVL